MHIGIIVSGVRPHSGGAYTFESELLDSLKRASGNCRHQFSVIYRDGRVCDLAGKVIWNQARSAKVKSVLANYLPWLNRAWRKQARSGGIIHWLDLYLHHIGIDIAWFLSPASRPVNIPYFTVVWDLQHRLQPHFPEVSSAGEWEAREATYAKVLRRASGVFAGTSAGRDEIERFYHVPKQRIHLLPHPTPDFSLNPPKVDDAAVLREFGLSPGYLFYPAQFWSHKNHTGLLRALSILKLQYSTQKQLVLVGSDKGNLPFVRQISHELGIADQVKFLNFVSREQLIALYRNADALTYVSFFGPENLPPLEAFALRCPVIASAVDGAQEQLGSAALLVNPDQPNEIAAAIFELLSKPALRDSMIAEGYQRAARFTGDDFVRGAIDAINRFDSVRQCWGKVA